MEIASEFLLKKFIFKNSNILKVVSYSSNINQFQKVKKVALEGKLSKPLSSQDLNSEVLEY